MKLTHPELRSRLAGEYVLGTLHGGARRRFEELLRSDYSLRAEVSKWEVQLTPLAARLKPVAPPDRVWTNIEARIDGRRAGRVTQSQVKAGWFSSLALWRGVGLAASVMLVAMLALKTNVNTVDAPKMLAVLEEADGARMVIEQPKAGVLKARLVRNWKSFPDKSHELWVIPASGAPRSLGVVNDTGETTITIAGLDSKLADGAVFAVTLEAKGGSPSGAPTGGILCKGAIARLPVKVPGQI